MPFLLMDNIEDYQSVLQFWKKKNSISQDLIFMVLENLWNFLLKIKGT